MNISFTFNEKQQRAFTKRITGKATAESLAVTLILEQVDKWVESDFQSSLSSIAEGLKTASLSTLDATVAQLGKK